MQDNETLDFFTDLPEQEQNSFLRTYLTETTRYLKAIPFPNSPGYSYYEHIFHDEEYHGNSITNLAALLHLLVARDVI